MFKYRRLRIKSQVETWRIWHHFLETGNTNLESFSCDNWMSKLSMMTGSGQPSMGSREKLFPTLISPRSITRAFREMDDCGMMMSGAFKFMSMDRRKLFCAKSRTLDAAFSAAWAVAALSASLAIWKLLVKFWKKTHQQTWRISIFFLKFATMNWFELLLYQNWKPFYIYIKLNFHRFFFLNKLIQIIWVNYSFIHKLTSKDMTNLCR